VGGPAPGPAGQGRLIQASKFREPGGGHNGCRYSRAVSGADSRLAQDAGPVLEERSTPEEIAYG
jgi:hypothetical protein